MALRRNRDFMLLQAGQLLSSAGSSFSGVAYPLLVLGMTHSPAKAGLVSFARLAPIPVLALLAGVAADRWPRKPQLLAADAARGLALAALAALVATDPVFWPLPFLAAIEGAGEAVFQANSVGAVRAVVPEDELPAAVTVQQARSATVGVAGPPAGGALFGIARFVPFAADAVSYTASFAAIAAMRTPFQQSREREDASIRTQLADGFRFLWREPFLRATTLLYSVGNFTIPAYLFVLVVVARRHGLTGGEIGILLAVFSASLLVGSIVSPLARGRLSLRAIMLLELYAGPAVVAYVIRPSVFVLAAALSLQAVVLPITDSVVISRRIAITPDRLLGRVEAARMALARVALPLGPLSAGLLLAAVSSRVTVAAYACLSAALAIGGTVARGLRV